MKKHEFRDLKIGVIEQYSMVVKKKDLPYWKNAGWLTFAEIGLPEGDEEAYLLYGEINKRETLIFSRPILLRDSPKEKLIGHKILKYSTRLGTYGMGGPGFFGLLLDSSEYLVYAVWGAGYYVIINDRVVECNSEFYKKTKPWVSNFGKNKTWDDLTSYISGSVIEDFSLSKDIFTLSLSKGMEKITVNLVRNDIKLPRKVGRKRNAYKKGEISDFILFQHENGALIV